MDISPANAPTIASYDALTDAELAAWDPEGDLGRRLLLNPTIFGMLDDIVGARVLDAGCGQGYLSRLLADRGAHVVGVDPATRLTDYARQREAERNQGVRYFQRDLSRLGEVEGPFDVVVANMVLLDIADWRSAMANCVAALRPGGRFVYSLLHPCWPPDATTTWGEGARVEIREYLAEYTIAAPRGLNFHRPISAYLNETVRLGCRLAEVAEPALDPNNAESDQDILVHIPNYIVVAADRS